MTKYHRTLGVGSKATKSEIRSAYLKLVKKHHPDNGGESDKFIEIQEAYNVLYNDKPPKGEENSGPTGFGEPGFNDFGGAFGNFRDLFGSFFTRERTYNYDKNVSLGMNFEDLNPNKNPSFDYEYLTPCAKSPMGYKKVRENIKIDISKISIAKILNQTCQIRFTKKGSLSSNLKHQGDLIVHLVFESNNKAKIWAIKNQLHSNLNVTVKEFINGASINTTILGKDVVIKLPILTNSFKTIKPSFTFNNESYSIVFSVFVHNATSINSKDRISNKL